MASVVTPTPTYERKRGELETYFDRTAADAWAKLTSDAPVSGIRATVRAGRDAMRATLLDWLPQDLSGRRILDAGCGAGQLSIEAAARGADVVAIDLAGTLVRLAEERFSPSLVPGSIEFRVGDMFDPALGQFDHVVAMDSVIHYSARDITDILSGFAERTERSLLFTFAPRTPALTVMHAAGKLFPRSDRSPAIQPVSEAHLRKLIGQANALAGWGPAQTRRIKSGFYFSQAMELTPA
ncbi:MAG: magnesium protoporphyrin IX methyltransferase [Pseudomonadota bacterium]